MDRQRRALLKFGSLIVLLPASRLISACSSDDNGDGDGDGSPTEPNRFEFTSSLVENHTHSVSVDESSFVDSPSVTIRKDTSEAEMHAHVVSLTEAELDAIQAGQTVSKETTEVNFHSHRFNFRLEGTPSPSPTPITY